MTVDWLSSSLTGYVQRRKVPKDTGLSICDPSSQYGMKKPTQDAAALSRDSRAQITPEHVKLDAMVKCAWMVHTVAEQQFYTQSLWRGQPCHERSTQAVFTLSVTLGPCRQKMRISNTELRWRNQKEYLTLSFGVKKWDKQKTCSTMLSWCRKV